MTPQENARQVQGMAALRAQLHFCTTTAMTTIARALAHLDEDEDDEERRLRGDSDRPSGEAEDFGPISTTWMAGPS